MQRSCVSVCKMCCVHINRRCWIFSLSSLLSSRTVWKCIWLKKEFLQERINESSTYPSHLTSVFSLFFRSFTENSFKFFLSLLFFFLSLSTFCNDKIICRYVSWCISPTAVQQPPNHRNICFYGVRSHRIAVVLLESIKRTVAFVDSLFYIDLIN